MAEGARLESVLGVKPYAGSNPALSASFHLLCLGVVKLRLVYLTYTSLYFPSQTQKLFAEVYELVTRQPWVPMA